MGLAGMTQDTWESHVPPGQQLEASWDIPEIPPLAYNDPAQTVADLNQNEQVHAECFLPGSDEICCWPGSAGESYQNCLFPGCLTFILAGRNPVLPVLP